MAYGPVMRVHVGEFLIELAPLKREDMSDFVLYGLQLRSVTQYLSLRVAPTLEDEYEWFEKTRTDRTSLIWGIFDITDNKRVVIGTTGVSDIQYHPIAQATSGVVIFRKEYWGKGIATAIHKTRTWYLFEQHGIERIKSAYLGDNIGSWKALEASGYSYVYTERNDKFVSGKMLHKICLECLNPSSYAWRRWWGDDRPTKKAIEARKRAIEALSWAEQNVTLL